MSEENQGASVGFTVEAGMNGKERKKRRKPYNYTLERLEDLKDDAGRAPMWEQVQDGFLSPEAAIEHVSKEKLTGRFRAIRVASDEYVSEMTRPEPVLTVTRVKKAKKA